MLFRVTTQRLWIGLFVLALAPVAGAWGDTISSSGITYSYGVAPNGGYGDAGLTKLTDGVTFGEYATVCAGWNSTSASKSDATITFNLSKSYLLDNIQVYYDLTGAAAISGWESWTVTMSNNADMSNPVYNHTFTTSELTTTAGWYQVPAWSDATNDGYHTGSLAVTPTQAAQYIKLVGTSQLLDCGQYGMAGWGMISEVQLSSIPEPSVIILLTTGLFGLLCYAWRKRN